MADLILILLSFLNSDWSKLHFSSLWLEPELLDSWLFWLARLNEFYQKINDRKEERFTLSASGIPMLINSIA